LPHPSRVLCERVGIKNNFGIIHSHGNYQRTTLALTTTRPIYALILLAISSFFMCTTFGPFLYSLVVPNENLQQFITALEGRAAPPLDSDMVVQQTMGAVGTLKRSIRIGYFYNVQVQIHYVEPRTKEKIEVSQYVDIAWFEKHYQPMVVTFTCYENDAGRRAYRISEVSPFIVMRGYAIPVCFFGISLFLARKRKPAASARSSLPV
jgi:hypothetical protein